MQIKTDMTARSIRAALAARQQFAIRRGRIIGILGTGSDKLDFLRRRAADTMLEQAAAAEGHSDYDADPVTIGADLISSDGETFAGVTIWIDRCDMPAGEVV